MDFKIVAVTIFQFLPVLVISTVGLEAIAAFFKKYPNPKKYLDTVFKNKSLCPFYCPGLFSLFLIHTQWRQSKFERKFEISRETFEKTLICTEGKIFNEFWIIKMQNWIDLKNKRCKCIIILQDLKEIFQKSQNYSKKGLLVTLLPIVTKKLFYGKSCVFYLGNLLKITINF